MFTVLELNPHIVIQKQIQLKKKVIPMRMSKNALYELKYFFNGLIKI